MERSSIRFSRATAALLGFLLLALTLAQSAAAADRVYWTNRFPSGSGSISFANLDNSGGGNLVTTGATVSGPFGAAIDPAAGRIYWANIDGNKISFAALDGSGGGDLSTSGATVTQPVGVSLDRQAGKIYWANDSGNKISYANLNGALGGDIATTTATVSGPFGVVVDPATERIYWTNSAANKISFANLDGSGGGDLNTGAAPITSPTGLALDPSSGKIYWANWSFGGGSIGFANLNGSGGGMLNTGTAMVSGAEGVALDPAANRIYWGNAQGNTISYANLDNTGGGGQVTTIGATTNWSVFPVLLKSPVGTGVPQITGGASLGSVLSCSSGSWAGDAVTEFLYRAPQAISYSWSLNGSTLGSATQSSLTASAPGEYRCTATARNAAGSTAQTSVPLYVPPASSSSSSPPPSSGSPRVTEATVKVTKVKLNKLKGTALLSASVSGAGTVTLKGKGVQKQVRSASQRGTVKLPVKATGSARKTLLRTGKAKVKLQLIFAPTGATKVTATASVTLRKT
jgi:DNA-binding beta-propeller fold protein YncE